MPRSNWKGYISFGLVNIPIILYSAENPAESVAFRQINRKTGARIKYKRIDSETGKEVPWEEVGRGYEYEKDVILPVEEDELRKVVGENARTIAIEEFIDKKNITPVEILKTYYLVPDKKGEKGYVILRSALSASHKVGIAKVIISTKEYLAALSVYENALVLYLLHYPEELRSVAELNLPTAALKKYNVTGKEIDIAKKLIKNMSAKWKPIKYKDDYKAAVVQWVSEKIRKLPTSKMKPRASILKTTDKRINFIDLLKRSLASSKVSKKHSGKKLKPIPAKQVSRKHVTTH